MVDVGRHFLRRTLSAVVNCLSGEETAQNTVEYALLAALLSIIAIGLLILIGPQLQADFQAVVNALSSVGGTPSHPPHPCPPHNPHCQ
jgi:Flp pilus assembly pilin Flp